MARDKADTNNHKEYLGTILDPFANLVMSLDFRETKTKKEPA